MLIVVCLRLDHQTSGREELVFLEASGCFQRLQVQASNQQPAAAEPDQSISVSVSRGANSAAAFRWRSHVENYAPDLHRARLEVCQAGRENAHLAETLQRNLLCEISQLNRRRSCSRGSAAVKAAAHGPQVARQKVICGPHNCRTFPGKHTCRVSKDRTLTTFLFFSFCEKRLKKENKTSKRFFLKYDVCELLSFT